MIKPTLRNLLRSPILWLSLALLAPFAPILLHPAGRVLGQFRGDGPSMFYMINNFAADCWRHGSIPMWNPYIMMGQPFLGEGQAALFHPLSWLFIALPTGPAINLVSALCFLLAGLAFYGYLRTLHLSGDASACGALVWCFSNIMVSRLYGGHLTNLLIFFELPLMLMLWERHRQSGSLRPLLGLALVYALMILAAHPQFLMIFSMFFLLYVLIPSALAATGGRAAALAEGKSILLLGCFVLLGIGIGALQLLPSADFAGQSFRAAASLEFCGSWSFPPENLLSLFVPRFFGDSVVFGYGQYWGRGNFWEMWSYIGALPLLLAVPGLLATPWRRRLTLGACAIIFTLFAFGAYTPLFPLIYKFIPGFSLFRGPSKNIHVAELCLATFSAYGLETLLHPAGGAADRRRLKAALITAAAGLAFIFVTFVILIPGANGANSRFLQLMAWALEISSDRIPDFTLARSARWAMFELLRSAFFLALAAAAVAFLWTPRWSARWPKARLPLTLGVILADLLLVFFPLFQTYDESLTEMPAELTKVVKNYAYPPRLLAHQFHPNRAMRYHFSNPTGYVGANLARFNTFMNYIQEKPLDTPQVFSVISTYKSGIRFFAFDAQLLDNDRLRPDAPIEVLARTTSHTLVRFAEPFPRAYLAPAPHACASAEEAMAYVGEMTNPLLERPAVELAVEALPPAAALARQEGALITAFSPNRVELTARAAQPRVLVLAEAYEKNWKATIDGKAAPVFPANYLFRGVIVPAGASHVVFSYEPAAFRWGALLSLLSLSGVLAVGLRLRREQPRAPLAPEESPLEPESPAPRAPEPQAVAAASGARRKRAPKPRK